MTNGRWWMTDAAASIDDPRLIAFVEARTLMIPFHECWEWVGEKKYNGYGFVRFGRRSVGAHRVAWEMHSGTPIPAGMLVCHHCDNRGCVRPSHLFLGTMADNYEDMKRKGRQSRPAGERNAHAKLTDAKVRAIRSSPLSNRAIAKELGVSTHTVWNVKSRTRWAHVQDETALRGKGE